MEKQIAHFNESGFTLLEVLIASVILAFMTLGVVEISDNSVNTKERVISEDQEVMQLQMAISRLEQDMALIYTPLFYSKKLESTNKQNPDDAENPDDFNSNPDTKGGGNPHFSAAAIEKQLQKYQQNDRFAFPNDSGLPVPTFKNPDKSTFEFLTCSNKRRIQDTAESSYSWIRYTLRPASSPAEHRQKPTFELVRAAVAHDPYNPEAIDYEKEKGFVLLDNILQWEFEFWDEKDKKFQSSLHNVPQGDHLLRAIKVKFKWLDRQNAEEEGERIFRGLWPILDLKNEKKSST